MFDRRSSNVIQVEFILFMSQDSMAYFMFSLVQSVGTCLIIKSKPQFFTELFGIHLVHFLSKKIDHEKGTQMTAPQLYLRLPIFSRSGNPSAISAKNQPSDKTFKNSICDLNLPFQATFTLVEKHSKVFP